MPEECARGKQTAAKTSTAPTLSDLTCLKAILFLISGIGLIVALPAMADVFTDIRDKG